MGSQVEEKKVAQDHDPLAASPKRTIARLWKTVSVYSCYFAIGLAMSAVGPAMVTLEILFDTDTKRISIGFIGLGIGSILASVITVIIYKKINKEILFTGSILLFGLGMASGPLSGHLYGFYIAVTLTGLGRVIITTGTRTYIIALWEDHRYRGTIVQAMYGLIGIGGIFGPLMVEPFLVDIITTDTTGGELNASYNHPAAYGQNSSGDHERDVLVSTPNATTYKYNATWDPQVLQRARYVFLPPALVCLLPVALFLLYLLGSAVCKLETCSNAAEAEPESGETTDAVDDTVAPKAQGHRYQRTDWTLLAIFFFQLKLFMMMEMVIATFLASFVVKGMGWTAEHGALIMSLYWIFSTLSKCLVIPISVVAPTKLIYLGNTLLVAVGGCLMIPQVHTLMWIASAIVGLGFGPVLGTCVVLASEHLKMTGFESAVLSVAMALGVVIGPVLVGVLFQTYGPMTFVYFILSSDILLAVLLLCTHLVKAKCSAKLTQDELHDPATGPLRPPSEADVEEL